MVFDSNNFTGSLIYSSYANFDQVFLNDLPNGNPPNGNPQNPYIIINNVTTHPEWGFNTFAINNLGNILNSYYLDVIPYFFLRFSCLDGVSDIKNVDSNFEQIKLPLKYFTSGDLFGLTKVLDSIKDGKDLQDIKSWNFFSSFTDNGTVSKTDDPKLNAEAVFYNTLYKYFNDGYYQLQLKSVKPEKYTVKGKIETDIQTQIDQYKKGSGEAPNYLDISVDSKQKVKNKVLLKARAIRTSYNSRVQAPQQIVFKKNGEELISSFALEEESLLNFSPNKEYFSYSATSLSNTSLEVIINNLIKPAILYFNIAHYILRSSSINYKFFVKNTGVDNDIFKNNSKQATDVKNIYSNKNAGLRELVQEFPIYLKELIVNLLNLVDSTQVGITCDKMLDYFQENNPNFNGLYSKSDLKNMLLKLNDMCFETYKISNPKTIHQNKPGGNIGKVTVGANLVKINLSEEVEHSNDLILQKVYIYKDIEKPLSYEDIIKQSKLYKIIDIPKNNNNMTLYDSILLEDNVDVNKKYYYCFLSEREYDLYDEIYNLKKEKDKGTIPAETKEIVQHFSSPTKVLELEMISTDNSTYLDYKFFIPEQKEIVKNKVNFYSKVRISPSDIQKNSFDINKGLTGEFVKKPGLSEFWYNTTQLISSNDYSSGRTLKVRISSPKTKRKIDFNVRHFVLDYYNLGNVNKKTSVYDIDVFSAGKKYYEVYSAIKPEVKFNFDYPNKKDELEKDLKAQKPIVYKIPSYKDPQIDDKNYIYNINDIKMSLDFKDPNVPKIKDYFKSWEVNLYDDKDQTISVYKDPSESGNKNYSFPNIISTKDYKKFTYEQKMKDKFDFNLSSSWEFQTDNKVVEYKLISQGTDKINEGDTKLFTLKITNYPPNKEKTIRWRLLGVNNSFPLNDFKFVEGKFKVNEKISDYIISLPADQNLNKTDTSNKTYKLIINKNYDLNLQTDDIFLQSDPFTVLDTSKAPLEIGQIIGKTSINEGELVEYSIQIKNRFKDEKFKWYLTFSSQGKADLSDFEAPLMQEQFLVFDNNDVAKIQIKPKQDASFGEGDEFFILSVNQLGKGEVKSTTITIKDTSIKQFKDSPDKSVGGSLQNPLSPKLYSSLVSSLRNEYNNVYYIDKDTHKVVKQAYQTVGNTRTDLGTPVEIRDSGMIGSKINPFPSFNSKIIDNFNTVNNNYQSNSNTLVSQGFTTLYYIDNDASILNSKGAKEFRKLIKATFDNNGNYKAPADNSVNEVTYSRYEGLTVKVGNFNIPIETPYNSVFPGSVSTMCNDGTCKILTTTPLKPIDNNGLVKTGVEITSPWHGIVTGSITGGQVWGSGIYSRDSDWSRAAVHAGLIKPGEIALISFEAKGTNFDFIGSEKFGVKTLDYKQITDKKTLYDGYAIKLVKIIYK